LFAQQLCPGKLHAECIYFSKENPHQNDDEYNFKVVKRKRKCNENRDHTIEE
jgi:hypothetical protein